MKVTVETIHDLSIDVGESVLSGRVDTDNTVKLILPTHGDETVETRWFTRDDLVALRLLVSRAIRILDVAH